MRLYQSLGMQSNTGFDTLNGSRSGNEATPILDRVTVFFSICLSEQIKQMKS